MSTDTRSPSEIDYDRTRLSPAPAAPLPLAPAAGPDDYFVSLSPDVQSAGHLVDVPVLALVGDVLTIRLGGSTEAEIARELLTEPEATTLLPQRIYSVTRLERRGLVIVDAEDDVFVMTAAEFAAQASAAQRAALRAQIASEPDYEIKRVLIFRLFDMIMQPEAI